MPCNCGKNKVVSKYEFTAPDGKTVVYPTETQARAAKIKAGGGTYKTVSK
jgi:hypothetical protein